MAKANREEKIANESTKVCVLDLMYRLVFHKEYFPLLNNRRRLLNVSILDSEAELRAASAKQDNQHQDLLRFLFRTRGAPM